MSLAVVLTEFTNVLTLRGYVDVSDLALGDKLILSDAQIGSLTHKSNCFMRGTTAKKSNENAPVMFEADSVGPGIPKRPLLVSANQQINLNGTLLPAELLVNGRTVRQEETPAVRCCLLEIEGCTSIYAEGLPIGTRSNKENLECNPSVIRAVRAILLKRAGIQFTQDPLVSLRATPHGIIILSRSSIPWHVTEDSDERRRLGIKLESIRIDDREVPADHPSLQLGWHEPEWDGRWTNGYALVPNELLRGSLHITFDIKATVRYPLDEDPLESIRDHSVF